MEKVQWGEIMRKEIKRLRILVRPLRTGPATSHKLLRRPFANIIQEMVEFTLYSPIVLSDSAFSYIYHCSSACWLSGQKRLLQLLALILPAEQRIWRSFTSRWLVHVKGARRKFHSSTWESPHCSSFFPKRIA